MIYTALHSPNSIFQSISLEEWIKHYADIDRKQKTYDMGTDFSLKKRVTPKSIALIMLLPNYNHINMVPNPQINVLLTLNRNPAIQTSRPLRDSPFILSLTMCIAQREMSKPYFQLLYFDY
jgi:hypothetical protein